MAAVRTFIFAGLLLGVLAGSAIAAESDAIPRSGKELTNANASAVEVRHTGYDTSRVGLALVCVVGLIFGLKWASARFLGTATSHRSSRAVNVLCRNTIGPRQNIVLVQIGRRLVLVGDSGTQLTTLGEITDADEVAEVVGQVGREKNELLPLGKTFGKMFQKAENGFDESTDEVTQGNANSDEGENAGAMGSDLAGLTSRIRSLSRQFGKA